MINLPPAANEADDVQETRQPPSVLPRADFDRARELAEPLLAALADAPDGDIIAEVIDNALKLLRDQTNRGDLKLINKTFKELRYALKVFAPYREVRKISIFGSARTPEDHIDYKQASDFASAMAGAGWMVITGAGGGIMAAGHGGAGAKPSFGLAIRLPFEQKANPTIADDPKLINFKYFFTRKLMFLRSSHAIALFPGGFGTMDEGFEVLTLVQTGKSVPIPIVLVDAPGGDYWHSWQHYVKNHLLARGLMNETDLRLYRITDNIQTALGEVRHFYSNYHSLRYTRDGIALRLQRKPSAAQLERLRVEFADLLGRGTFTVTGPLPAERDEPSLQSLHRLLFDFNHRDHARLRMLIDFLNDLPEEP
jgi:uncharacterized protein (TIGR00730 family)